MIKSFAFIKAEPMGKTLLQAELKGSSVISLWIIIPKLSALVEKFDNY